MYKTNKKMFYNKVYNSSFTTARSFSKSPSLVQKSTGVKFSVFCKLKPPNPVTFKYVSSSGPVGCQVSVPSKEGLLKIYFFSD